MVIFDKYKYKKIIHLETYIIHDKKVVKSFEFYKKLGLGRSHYDRWLTYNVFPSGIEPRDFFPTEDNQPGRVSRYRLRYYLVVDFAIGLCMMAKTKDALKIKEFLIENK